MPISSFAGCTSLTNINIPNSVTSIGVAAFNGCPSLTSITIPNSVTIIRDHAFWNCQNLTNLFFIGNAPSGNWAATVNPAAIIYYIPGTMGWDNLDLTAGVKVLPFLFRPSLKIAVSRIAVGKVQVSLDLMLGRNYQLEASLDLKTWASVGEPFVAQSENIAQEFDLDSIGRYFRISETP